MPSYTFGDYCLLLLGASVLSALGSIMVRPKSYRQWPAFFLYVVFHIFQPGLDLIGVFQSWNQGTYYYFFYCAEAVSLALSFGVIYEVFLFAMEPYDTLRRIGRRVFFISATALLLLGILFIVFGPSNDGVRTFKVVFYSERSLRIIQVGLLLFLFGLSRSFGFELEKRCLWHREGIWDVRECSTGLGRHYSQVF